MSAGIHDIVIDQKADFSILMYYTEDDGVTPVIISGAYMQVRDTASSAEALATATMTHDNATGEIKGTISRAVTSAIGTTGKSFSDYRACVYDVVVKYADGTTERIINGISNISPGVTTIE